uniref:Ribbon-helix-helix protein, copG family n=1 Tax=Candidatus Kentrum sp. LPFa TaxID=2126335 RepID=A0A450WEI5_9GAMM|nr:MAG: hypothetical protein BECKLPF1236B_GA0070989_107712 [Candidatus Kentron sp. LPFa]
MTQMAIHLTRKELDTLAFLAHKRSREQTDLIREAVDTFLVQQPARRTDRRRVALNQLAGIWRNRTDLPDFAALRREWDRSSD